MRDGESSGSARVRSTAYPGGAAKSSERPAWHNSAWVKSWSEQPYPTKRARHHGKTVLRTGVLL